MRKISPTRLSGYVYLLTPAECPCMSLPLSFWLLSGCAPLPPPLPQAGKTIWRRKLCPPNQIRGNSALPFRLGPFSQWAWRRTASGQSDNRRTAFRLQTNENEGQMHLKKRNWFRLDLANIQKNCNQDCNQSEWRRTAFKKRYWFTLDLATIQKNSNQDWSQSEWRF